MDADLLAKLLPHIVSNGTILSLLLLIARYTLFRALRSLEKIDKIDSKMDLLIISVEGLKDEVKEHDREITLLKAHPKHAIKPQTTALKNYP